VTEPTSPSSPSGYTYPTHGTPPPPYPGGSAYSGGAAYPSRPSTGGVAAVVGFAVVGLVMLGAAALFFFGLGTHVESVSVTGAPVAVPLEGYSAEPLPAPGPLDTRVTTPLLAAAEAESSYRGEYGSYTGAMSELRAFSYLPAKGVRVEALTADVDRFCLRATDGKVTWYVSSDDPTGLSTTSCA
jgi:hypothetical protein